MAFRVCRRGGESEVMDRRVWVTAAALVLLVLGMQIRDLLPSAGSLAQAHFDYHGSHAPMVGDINNVRATVTQKLNGKDTNASWVILEYDYTKDANGPFHESLAAPDGTTYYATISMHRGCGLTYPGLVSHCAIVFEIPKEQLGGAELRVAQSNRMGPRLILPIQDVTEVPEVHREDVEL